MHVVLSGIRGKRYGDSAVTAERGDTRSASMHFAQRAALQLRKTAVLPFCHSTHSHRYGHIYLLGFQSGAILMKLG